MMKTIHIKTILSLFFVTPLILSCDDILNRCIEGDGDREIETRNLDEFSRIEINGDFEVQIDTSSFYSATIESDENLMGKIITRVSGDKLVIEARNNTCLKPSHPIEITVATREIDEIRLNGSGFVYCTGFETDEFSLGLAGSGQIEMEDVLANSTNITLDGSGSIYCTLLSEDLKTSLSGSGDIKIQGDNIIAHHIIAGSGKINASELISDECHASITGSGVIDVHVLNALEATIVGSGIIYYSGNPAIQSHITGSGEIIER